jgi:hypothetical protein
MTSKTVLFCKNKYIIWSLTFTKCDRLPSKLASPFQGLYHTWSHCGKSFPQNLINTVVTFFSVCSLDSKWDAFKHIFRFGNTKMSHVNLSVERGISLPTVMCERTHCHSLSSQWLDSLNVWAADKVLNLKFTMLSWLFDLVQQFSEECLLSYQTELNMVLTHFSASDDLDFSLEKL